MAFITVNTQGCTFCAAKEESFIASLFVNFAIAWKRPSVQPRTLQERKRRPKTNSPLGRASTYRLPMRFECCEVGRACISQMCIEGPLHPRLCREVRINGTPVVSARRRARMRKGAHIMLCCYEVFPCGKQLLSLSIQIKGLCNRVENKITVALRRGKSCWRWHSAIISVGRDFAIGIITAKARFECEAQW